MMFFGIIFLSIHLTSSNPRFVYYIYYFSTVLGLFAVLTFIVILIDIANGFAGLDNCNLLSYLDLQNEYQKKLE